jgi:hypothetical protein
MSEIMPELELSNFDGNIGYKPKSIFGNASNHLAPLRWNDKRLNINVNQKKTELILPPKKINVIIIPEDHSPRFRSLLNIMIDMVTSQISKEKVVTITEGSEVEELIKEKMPFATHITEISEGDNLYGQLHCAKFVLIILNIIRIMDIYAISIADGKTPPSSNLTEYTDRFYTYLIQYYDLIKYVPVKGNDVHTAFNSAWMSLFLKRGDKNGITQYIQYTNMALKLLIPFLQKCENKQLYQQMLSDLKVDDIKQIKNRSIVLTKKWREIIRDILDVLLVEKIKQYALNKDINTIIINCGVNHYYNLIKLVENDPTFILPPLNRNIKEIADKIGDGHYTGGRYRKKRAKKTRRNRRRSSRKN